VETSVFNCTVLNSSDKICTAPPLRIKNVTKAKGVRKYVLNGGNNIAGFGSWHVAMGKSRRHEGEQREKESKKEEIIGKTGLKLLE